MKKHFLGLLAVLVLSSSNLCAEDTIPTVEFGTKVFAERCSLCHGSQALGEGKLALKIASYPNTNLMTDKIAKSLDDVRNIVVYGGTLSNVSKFMPPFGNELTWTEIESVSLFLVNFRESPDTHLKMLKSIQHSSAEGSKLGREIFESRCTLCHGINGEGDGRMKKVIKSPPPYNLTKSVMPKEYLKQIVTLGGEPMSRSPQMPPWGDQLNDKEIDAVAEYIIGLRTL